MTRRSTHAPAEMEPASSPAPRRPAWRRPGVWMGLVATVPLLASFWMLETTSGATWLARRAVALVMPPGSDVRLDALHGGVLRRIELEGLLVRSPEGDTILRVDTLTAGYRLRALLSRRLDLGGLRVLGAHLSVAQTSDSTWGLPGSTPPSGGGGSPWTVTADSLRVGGGAADVIPRATEALRLRGLNLALHDLSIGRTAAARVDTLTGRLRPPAAPPGYWIEVALAARLAEAGLTIEHLSMEPPNSRIDGVGSVGLPGDGRGATVDLDVEIARLAVGDLTPFLPFLRGSGVLAGRMAVAGPLDSIRADGVLDDGADGQVVLDVQFLRGEGARPGLRGSLAARALDARSLLGDTVVATSLNADVRVDLSDITPATLSGTLDVDVRDSRLADADLQILDVETRFENGRGEAVVAAHVSGFSADGRVTLDGLAANPTYDARGSFHWRVPPSAGRQGGTLRGRWSLEGVGIQPDSLVATAETRLMDGSTWASAEIRGARARASVEDGQVAFDADATTGEGTAELAGTAALGDTLRVHLDHLRVHGLDVAAFVGDSVGSTVTARVAGSAAVRDGALISAEGQLRVDSARYATVRVPRATADVRSSDGRLTITADAGLQGGTTHLEGWIRPLDSVPTFALTDATFRGVQVAGLVPDSTWTGELNGSATLRGSGRSPATMRLDATVRIDSSRVNAQPIESGRLTATVRAGMLQVEGGLIYPQGTLETMATARPFGADPSFDLERLRFSGLDPGSWLGQPALSGSLNGEGVGRFTGLSPASALQGELTIHLDSSRVRRGHLRSADARLVAARDHVTIDAEVDHGGAVSVASAELDLTEAEPRYSGEARLAVPRLDRYLALPLSDADSAFRSALVATLRGSGRGFAPARATGVATIDLDSLVVGDAVVDSSAIALRWDAGTITADTVVLAANVGRIDGGGSLALPGSDARSDFALQVSLTDLSWAEPLVPFETLALATGTGTLAVRGPADQWEVASEGRLSAVLVDDMRLTDLRWQGGARLDRERSLRFAESSVTFDQLAVPQLSVENAHLEVVSDGDEIVLALDATVDGRRDLQGSARLDPRPDRRVLTFERMDVRFDDDRWVLRRPSAVSYRDGLRFDSLQLSSGAQSLLLHGGMDGTGAERLIAEVSDFRVGAVSDLLALETLDGVVSADLVVSGTAEDPAVDLRVDAALSSATSPSTDVQVAVRYADATASVDGALSDRHGHPLTVNGTIPLRLRLVPDTGGALVRSAPGAVDLRVQADSFALRWVEPFLDPRVAKGIEGELEIDATVGGTADAPTLMGTASLTRGRLGVPPLGVAYEDAFASVTLGADRIVLDSARVTDGDGSLTASGEIALRELSLGEYDIDAAFDGFRLLWNELAHATASGEVALSGTTLEPRLTGSVVMEQTDVFLDRAVSGATVEDIQLTQEDLDQLEDYFGFPVQPDDGRPPLFVLLDMDVDVELRRDTWVRQQGNPKLAIQLTGSLDVTKAPGDSVRAVGDIQTVAGRSFVQQFGKRFEVREGVIRLRGGPEDVEVDLTAAYAVPSNRSPDQAEVEILLEIEGRMGDLRLVLSSEPQMAEDDIVSYLATGRPASQALDLGSGSNGRSLVVGEATGVVEDLVSRRVGLDVVDIRSDGDGGTTLVAGRYVNPELYLGFKWPFGSQSAAQSSRTGRQTAEIEIEYQALRWLLLNLETGGSAFGFFLRSRYAY